jgi:hypothetical protein
MKARYILTVAGVSALGLFGVYGTSDAATAHSTPTSATHICALPDGAVITAVPVTGKPAAGKTVAPAKAVAAGKAVPQLELKAVKAVKAVPADGPTFVCAGHAVPGKGPVLTVPGVAITIAVPATPAVPAAK